MQRSHGSLSKSRVDYPMTGSSLNLAPDGHRATQDGAPPDGGQVPRAFSLGGI